MYNQQKEPLNQFQPNRYPLEPGLRLLEASAGTGKTFAIAHLVLRLLTEGGNSLKEILVVTFTNSAAKELRARITTRLEAALESIESLEKGLTPRFFDDVFQEWLELNLRSEENRNHWKNLLIEALENIDNAEITTIHGFCRRTLQREAIESSAVMNPILEETSQSLISEVVHNYWQNQVLSLNSNDLKGLKTTGLSIENLAAALSKIDSDASLTLRTDSSDLNTSEPLVNQFSHRLQEYWSDFVSCWQKEGKDLDTQLKSQCAYWRANGFMDTKPFSPNPIKDRYRILDNWIKEFYWQENNITSLKNFFYNDIRKQALLGKYFHPGCISNVARKCGEDYPLHLTKKLQVSIARLWDGPAELVWQHALKWTSDLLAKRRYQSGVISYSGLLQSLDPEANSNEKSIEKTPKISRLIEKLRRRYRIALIDEFQDTDALQWRLIKQVFAHEVSHLLLMVGDPKQAIYQFRGGDLNTYLLARSQVDRIDFLLDNYRTKGSLMREMNKLMSTGLFYSKLDVPALTPRVEETLGPAKERSPLQLVTITSSLTQSGHKLDGQSSKGDLEEIIPIAVTNTILKKLKSNSDDINPSDICILVGRHDQAARIREKLALAGLPTRLTRKGDILTSEAANILQRFLDSLANPGDNKTLRLLATSALMQWDVKRLKNGDQDGGLDKLATQIKFCSDNFSKLGLLGCISEIMDSTIIADLSERGRILGDIQQCSLLVQEEIHAKGLDVISAGRWLRRERLHPKTNVPENREPHSDNAESAINVVTIHRSKGLEYRIVICPYLWQSPPAPKGPLWRSQQTKNWLIALNTSWGEGEKALEEATQASLEESERLAYVAFTRAIDQLIVIWANVLHQEGNPLKSFLYGPKNISSNIDNLPSDSMSEWLKANDININVTQAETSEINEKWIPKRPLGELKLGPTPQRKLDINWGRSSYSGWVHSMQNGQNKNLDPMTIEDGKDIDQVNQEDLPFTEGNDLSSNESKLENVYIKTSPLSNFPRGPAAGDCLHKILEKIDFQKSLYIKENESIIEDELNRNGIDVELIEVVQNSLTRVLNTRMGGPLGNLKLNQLNRERRLHELNFDLPIAHSGRKISSLDIANIFKQDPEARFSSNYSRTITALDIHSRGFLTGSVDLVFTDQEDLSKAKWWVLDWKSNWIGPRNQSGEYLSCTPMHYNQKAMEEQMILHHYPLQAHLYLVALHRFLKWRLPNYSPNEHLGGYVYLFLRGVPDQNEVKEQINSENVSGLLIEKAPIKRVLEFNQLIQDGGK